MTHNLERRQYPRFQINNRTAVMFGQVRIRDIYHGDTSNLSLGGASILCNLKLREAMEEVVIFLFAPTPQIQHIKTRARVLHASSFADSTSRLRVAFTDFCGDGIARLTTLLEANPHLILTDVVTTERSPSKSDDE